MQTRFTAAQLQDPEIASSAGIIRRCVHCGFCTATCPTFVLLGDELDSPRGRIYLIKDMLENDRPATEEVVRHVDRCLSCLSCMTTCPSGVHYQHLVDHARAHIERTYRRPAGERALRRLLAAVLPFPRRLRLALTAARLGCWTAPLLPPRLRAMLTLAPRRLPADAGPLPPQVFPALGPRRHRVALLAGCAQQVLAPEINRATIALLTRSGAEVVIARGAGCCGALVHHLGQTDRSHHQAAANIRAWTAAAEAPGGLDAVLINASGCGTQVKDYGFMLRDDPDLAAPAARVSALALDISEWFARHPPIFAAAAKVPPLRVAYHAACSLQHGQQVTEPPKMLLAAAGFQVLVPAEAHLCCGSAGVYNILQPAIAGQLRSRKVGHLEGLRPDVIATGNIGCLTQIAGGTKVPVVHVAALLDWAAGGAVPQALVGRVEALARSGSDAGGADVALAS